MSGPSVRRPASVELSPVPQSDVDEAARRRAAVELIQRHERTLRRTARRYSLCSDDAEDAYQRALEILLTKAPTCDQRELIRWMQTVTKHEALAVRRNRERLLGRPTPPSRDGAEEQDWVQLIPSERAGPADLTERRERVAQTREALQTLKPQELRALTLLAEGYSYSEIGEITGWTYTLSIEKAGGWRFSSVLWLRVRRVGLTAPPCRRPGQSGAAREVVGVDPLFHGEPRQVRQGPAGSRFGPGMTNGPEGPLAREERVLLCRRQALPAGSSTRARPLSSATGPG